MPAKSKSQVNGFWLFAQKTKPTWKAQGMKINTNDQLMAIAAPLWKALPQAQRQAWDHQAKEERRLRKDGTGDMGRLDNVGNVIGTRKDPAEEARRRREHELYLVTSQWEGKDLTQEPFYFINFQEMCELTDSDNTVEREWLPRELAMVEYTLKNGITQFYHQFIWPGDIPLGFRYHAETVSSEIHKIPIERMEEDSDDYRKIWRKMLQLVSAGVKDGQYPPLYCLGNDYEKMKYLSDWLWAKSMDGTSIGSPDNPLGKIYCIEDMVVKLIASSGRPGTESVAKAQVVSRLDGSQWEYIPATTCEFHQKMEVSRHCALAVVRRTAYTISDMVGIHYGIDLSERHVPVWSREDAPGVARVLPPDAVPLFGAGQSRGRRKERPAAPSARPLAGSTYSQLARPAGLHTGRSAPPEEEEEFAGREITEEERQRAPAVPPSNLMRGTQFVPRKYEAPLPPPGPASGQFDDSVWPQLGGAKASADQEASITDPEEDFPALTKMSLSGTSSAWLTAGGRGVTPASTPSPTAQPPPGLGLAGRGLGWGSRPEPAGVGRGLPVSGSIPPPPSATGWPPNSVPVPTAATNATPPLGRGTSEQLSQGLSLAGVGQGVAPPGVGQGAGPPVGRGRMLPVGRGAMPAAAGRGIGVVPPVGRGAMPPPSVGRGSRGEAADISQTHQPPSTPPSGVPSPGLSAYKHGQDLDVPEGFEPRPSGDFSTQRGGGRGVAPGGQGVGPSVGRGYHPSRGRGYMPVAGGTASVGRGLARRGGDADVSGV